MIKGSLIICFGGEESLFDSVFNEKTVVVLPAKRKGVWDPMLRLDLFIFLIICLKEVDVVIIL